VSQDRTGSGIKKVNTKSKTPVGKLHTATSYLFAARAPRQTRNRLASYSSRWYVDRAVEGYTNTNNRQNALIWYTHMP
jgi:hypothetical protein